MSTVTRRSLDEAVDYEGLLDRFAPRVIHDERQYQETLQAIEQLMKIAKPKKAHLDFIELLAGLVEDYEATICPAPEVSVPSILSHLIEARGATKAEIARQTNINRSLLTDVLAGRRGLSLENMKRLANYFSVDVRVFIDAQLA
jgi:HTH-type transcriptional regulator/antitoxin HigA